MKNLLLVLFSLCAFVSVHGYDKTENLLVNGDFSNGLEGWETVVSSNSNYTKIWVEDGVCHFKAGVSGSWSYYNCRISQTMKLQPGKYKCSFNYEGSFYEGGCCKIFRIITSDDEIIDTNDEYLINEVKDYSNQFKSEYSFTIYKEQYVMYLLSVQDHYGTVTSISDCKLLRETMFLEPEVVSYSRVYGDENPTFDVVYRGVIQGDESMLDENLHLDFECNANKYSDVGEYPIKLICTGNVTGYEIKKCNDGTLTVVQAPINVSCNNLEREYGEPNPEPTIKYEGFKNEENNAILTAFATYSINASETSDVGVYPIILSGAKGKNYRFEYNDANMTIKKAPLSGKVNDCVKIYGESNPTFSISYNGLKNNELSPSWVAQPKFIINADKFSNVGSYSVSVSDLEAKNYTINTIEDGELTISPKNLVLKVKDSERLYFQDNPDFSYTTSGFVNGDNISCFMKKPEFSTDATLNSNVGEYLVEIYGAEATNYEISYSTGCLKVNKRLLTVIADDKHKSYKTDNPVLTYTITGFVNNENEGILLIQPNVQTTATKISDCGDYIINVFGANAINYDFDYKNGILTITKIDQIIQWNQSFDNIHIGDQIELLAIADSGLPIEYLLNGNVEEYKSGDRTFIDCLGKGDVTIRAIQEGNINYNPAVRVVKSFTISDDASIGEISSDNNVLNIYTRDGFLINDSYSHDYVELYNLAGHCLYAGRERKIHIGRGLFIIRVGGNSYKLICR